MERVVKKKEGRQVRCYTFDFQKLKKQLNITDVEECIIQDTDSDTD